jgi:hypothetical protein
LLETTAALSPTQPTTRGAEIHSEKSLARLTRPIHNEHVRGLLGTYSVRVRTYLSLPVTHIHTPLCLPIYPPHTSLFTLTPPSPLPPPTTFLLDNPFPLAVSFSAQQTATNTAAKFGHNVALHKDVIWGERRTCGGEEQKGGLAGSGHGILHGWDGRRLPSPSATLSVD